MSNENGRKALAMVALGSVLFTLLEPAGAQPKVTPEQQQRIEQAKAREAQAKALLAKYTATPGRDDSDALLKEPAVQSELKRLVGNQLPKLMHNINVRGAIAYDGGSLVIAGNAPHKGGEEEGVVCISPYSPGLVEAGLFSRGKITVFGSAEKYEYLTICVKDWITQVNSGHRDRTTQPKNVSLVPAK